MEFNLSTGLAAGLAMRLALAFLLVLGLLAGVACSDGGGEKVEVELLPASATLDFLRYQGTAAANYSDGVNAVFDRARDGGSCSASGCHAASGGAGGSLKLFAGAAPDSPEMTANFLSAQALVNITAPEQSKLLLEPLAGTSSLTGSHAGGDIFPSVADTDYLRILGWISSPVGQ